MTRKLRSLTSTAAVFTAMAWTLSVHAQDADRSAEPMPDIQRLYVPRGSVSEILPRLSSADDPVHILDAKDFEQLLEQRRLLRNRQFARRPSVCRLDARFDPEENLLIGMATFETPDAGADSDVVLSPWNLSLEPAEEAARPLWGTDQNGDLRAQAVDGASVSFDWKLAAVVDSKNKRFDLRVPQTAAAYLDLHMPSGWGVRTTQRMIPLSADGLLVRIFFGGSSGLSLEMLPAESLDARRSVLTWRSQQVLRFDESSTDVEVIVRLESLHEPTPTVSFLVDRALQPTKLSVPIHQWAREETEEGPVRWTATFRRPPLGPFEVVFQTSLPSAPGTFFHPLLAHVEGAMPRDETLDFSIDRSLRIVELDAGNYQNTYTGVDQDGRYHMVLKGAGGVRHDAAAMRLGLEDVDDWPALFARLQQLAAGANNPAGQLFQRLDGQAKQTIDTVINSARTDPEALGRALDAVNEAMSDPSLFTPESIAGLPAAREAYRLLSREEERLSTTQIVRANRLVLEALSLSQFRTSVASQRPPTIRLSAGRPDVEVSLDTFLKLQRDQVRLMAQIRWVCHQGTLYQPQVQAPADWEVISVEQLGSRGGSIPYRTEPLREGVDLIWLELEEWLGSQEELQVRILAAPREPVMNAVDRPTRLPLAELLPVGFPFSRPSVYSLLIDPDVPRRLDELPPARLDQLEIPAPLAGEDVEQHSFSYESPLEIEPLQLLPRPPRFAVAASQRWEWDVRGWKIDWTIETAMQQGAISHLDLLASAPIPESAELSIDARGNRVRLLALDPPRQEDGRYRYRLNLEAPIRKTTVISMHWTLEESAAYAPLVGVVGAERFRGDVQVYSRTGQLISVDANQLVRSDASRTPPSPTAPFLLFSSSYIQLRPEMSLRLETTSPTTPPARRGMGKAWLHCRSSIHGDQTVEQVFAWLDCNAKAPLTIRVPGDCHLWSVALDGQTVQPWTSDGAITLPGELESGLHSLELTYAHSNGRKWGVRMIEAPMPLTDWTVVSLVHEVEYAGKGVLVPGPNLEISAGILFEAAGATGIRGAGVSQSQTDRVAAAMESAYSSLSEPQQLDLPTLLIELNRSLPEDLVLGIDEPAVFRSAGRPETNVAPTTFEKWLQQKGLVLIVASKACILTDRMIADAGDEATASAGMEAWLDEIALQLRRQGADPAGRFLGPVRFAARFEDRALTESVGLAAQSSQSQKLQRWILVSDDPDSLTTLRATVIPRKWLQRGSLIAVAVLLGLVWGLSTRISLDALRWWAVGLLAAMAGLTVAGGVLERLLGTAGWLSVLAVFGVLLVRSAWRPWAASAAIALAALSSGNALAQEKNDDDASAYRVIIPLGGDGEKQVYVPQSLMEKLREAAGDSGSNLLLPGAEYRGTLKPDQQIQWNAKLRVYVDPRQTFPTALGLRFRHVAVDAIAMDGEPVERFRPAGGDADLEIEVRRAGIHEIEIDFHAPLLGSANERLVQFGIPACASNTIRLELGDRAVGSVSSDLPSSLRNETDEQGTAIVGELGYADQLRLRWLPRTTTDNRPARFSMTSAHLMELTEGARDMLSVFRVQLAEGEIDELSWTLSPDIVIRRVDSERLSSWESTEDPENESSPRLLNVRLSSPQEGTFDVRIQSMLRVNSSTTVRFPEIAPVGAVSEDAILGVEIPRFWRIEEERLRNAEPATLSEFAAVWDRLGPKSYRNLAIAKRFRQRPMELTLKATPEAATWTVNQSLSVSPNPAARVADLRGTITLHRVGGRVGSLRFHLPAGFELQRVTGENLYQWYRHGNAVTLLPEREVSDQESFVIEGRWRSPFARADDGESAAFNLSAFDWPQAERVETFWTVQPSDDWTCEISNLVNVSEDSRSESGSIRVSSSQSRHSFRATLQPITPLANVTSYIVASVDDEKVVFEGMTEIDFQRGQSRWFYLETPRDLGPVEWISPMASKPSVSPRGDWRLWSLEPETQRGQRRRIEWRVARQFPPDEQIEIPAVRLQRFETNDELIVLADSSGLATPAIHGLESTSLPEDAPTWLSDRVGPNDPSVEIFQPETPEWRLLIERRQAAPKPRTLQTRHAQADIVVSQNGLVYGVSRWEVLYETGGALTVDLPTGCRPSDLWLDGRPVLFPSVQPNRLQFPIQSRSGWQSVALYWTLPASDFSLKAPLPRLQVGQPDEYLIRLRVPDAIAVAQDVRTLDRVAWLGRQFDDQLVRLKEALQQWQRSPNDPLNESAATQALDRCRFLLLKVEEAQRSPGADARATEQMQQRFDEAIRQHLAQSLVQRTRRRPLVSPEPNQVHQWAISTNTYYIVADVSQSEIPLVSATSLRRALFRSADWIWVLSAAVGITALTVPALTAKLQLFWPGLCFPLGIIWLRWSQTPLLGLCLLAISLAICLWTVRRWFAFPTPLGERASTTILQPPSVRSAEIGPQNESRQ